MTSAELLLSTLLRKFNWEALRTADGPATDIPEAIERLITASSPEAAESAYWEIDNVVVVQRALSDSAVATTEVLLCCLAIFDLPRFVRIEIYNFLFEVVCGESNAHEIANGNVDLQAQCQEIVAKAYWLFVRDYFHGERIAAKELLNVLDMKHIEFE